MKKLFTLVFFAMAGCVAMAQNIQLHYDFGHGIYDELKKTDGSYGRPSLTTTVEMFRPDSFGSTFFFIDFDYSTGVKGSYWELAREFCFWQESDWNWLSVHAEYNGGGSQAVGTFNDSWLAGLTYSGHSKDFSKTWSLSAMYKYIPHTRNAEGELATHNFQITGVWGINFAGGWCTFSGFIDFWREHRAWQGTSCILLSEPQFWVNLNKIRGWDKINFSVGTEVEVSNNFVAKGLYVIPTVAAKWTF
ncbi:MAG: DUF5020 family protein [Alistipes sp.]|nr:DUF5020 family protein [Alistipes sp.]